PHVLRGRALGDGPAPGRDHPRGHVPRHPRGEAGRDPGRHRPRHPAVRRIRTLQRGPRVLRPRHRQGLPRRPAGAALRQAGAGHGAEGRHDLHHRADDQRGHPLREGAARRLDRGHQGPQTLGAVGAHRGGDRRRGRDPDPPAGRRQRPVSAVQPRPADDAGWAAAARAALAGDDAAFAARFDAGEDIDRLLAARTRAVDEWVRQAWQRCIGQEPTDIGLFAIGGYGRGELFPHSDIDLLVLAEPEAQQARHDALARLFALLWDAGLPVGHAVRSAAECSEAAAADITVLTAMLEARPLQTNAAEVARLQEAIAPEHAWPPREYFLAKRAEQRERHARFDDTADNLEPNLKEGPGGLRDVHTLHWMALRVLGARGLEPLVALGQFGADEYATLERQRRDLSRLRWGLHLVAGRREERLRFDYQKALAERLGHTGDAGNLAVEQMMQGFYRSAALVLRINERLLQRFEEQLEGDAPMEPLVEPMAEGFAVQRGYLHATSAGWPHGIDDV